MPYTRTVLWLVWPRMLLVVSWKVLYALDYLRIAKACRASAAMERACSLLLNESKQPLLVIYLLHLVAK